MDKMVTIDEAARYFSVSKSTIRGWIRRKLLPATCYVKIGNTYRFNIEKMVSTFKPDVDKPVTKWEEFPYGLENQLGLALEIADFEGVDAVPPAEDIVPPLTEADLDRPVPPRLSPVDVFGDDEDEDEPN